MARNPVLVLCSSVGIVLVLCLGLIRFQVETRPEKVESPTTIMSIVYCKWMYLEA